MIPELTYKILDRYSQLRTCLLSLKIFSNANAWSFIRDFGQYHLRSLSWVLAIRQKEPIVIDLGIDLRFVRNVPAFDRCHLTILIHCIVVRRFATFVYELAVGKFAPWVWPVILTYVGATISVNRMRKNGLLWPQITDAILPLMVLLSLLIDRIVLVLYDFYTVRLGWLQTYSSSVNRARRVDRLDLTGLADDCRGFPSLFTCLFRCQIYAVGDDVLLGVETSDKAN